MSDGAVPNSLSKRPRSQTRSQSPSTHSASQLQTPLQICLRPRSRSPQYSLQNRGETTSSSPNRHATLVRHQQQRIDVSPSRPFSPEAGSFSKNSHWRHHGSGSGSSSGNGDSSGTRDNGDHSSCSGRADWKARMQDRLAAPAMMIAAQFFAAAMAAATRVLETDRSGDSVGRAPMHPFQVLSVRMGITVAFSLLYMQWRKVPHAPLGLPEVRLLLALRGVGGSFGAWACSLMIKTPFSRTQKLAGFVSIFGVFLIARPFSAGRSFSTDPASSPPPILLNETTASPSSLSSSPSAPAGPTAAEHAIGVAFALMGVCGAATAYTTISAIGKRAHILLSVNYLGIWCLFVSVFAMVFIPGVPFRLPADGREWALITLVGLLGLTMQLLLTSSLAKASAATSRKDGENREVRDGLSTEGGQRQGDDDARNAGGKEAAGGTTTSSTIGSSAVLNLVYLQILFALGFDKIIWGETPDLVSLIGGSLVLGSCVWATIGRGADEKSKKNNIATSSPATLGQTEDEEMRLMPLDGDVGSDSLSESDDDDRDDDLRRRT